MKGKPCEFEAENRPDVFIVDRADRPFKCTGANLNRQPPVYPDRT
jgi:hypothetical protein